MGRSVAIIFVASFIIVIFASGLASVLFDRSFYTKEYEKNGAYERIGKNLTLAVTDNLFNFFRGKEGLEFFSPEERSHLADVRRVIRGGYVLYGIAIVSLIASLAFMVRAERKRRGWMEKVARRVARLVLIAAAITVGLVLLLGVLSFLDFSGFFSLFHQVFFPQGNYTFPDYYPLIVLYPLAFWEDAAMLVGMRIVITAGIVALVSGIVLRLSRSEH